MRYRVWITILVVAGGTMFALPVAAGELEPAVRSETLWIFDADFEDLVSPDNLGWTSIDYSGTTFHENHWHKDTIRINGFEHLGDSTWWCGMCDTTGCWVQPRGYGNDWCQLMWRDFPLAEWSETGDTVTLEWDQRFAMEMDYDFGHVEVSGDGGDTWTTLYTVNNPGWTQGGLSQDWDSADWGHPVLDVSAYAGSALRLRYRFESDQFYSSQDEEDNPPLHSVLDGAWQLDNILWKVNGTTVWLDDCESPGDNGWQHPDRSASGQTGTPFQRSSETVMGGEPRWMMVAYDEASGLAVDDHDNWLLSPPIDISGVEALVVRWSGWIDMPEGSGDYVKMYMAAEDDPACLGFFMTGRLPSRVKGPYSGGPHMLTVEHDAWQWVGWHDWIITGVRSYNDTPAGTPDLHGLGYMLDRVRVGIPFETSVPDEPTYATRLLTPSPNPFNPATTVAYSVASSGRVTIRVHDIAGRIVRTLVDAPHDAGEFDIGWDGRTDAGDRAASGVYFVRMTMAGGDGGRRGSGIGAESRQQKLVLLK